MSRKITSGEWDGLFAARGRARPGAEARRVERLMAEAVRTEALRVCRCFAALPEHLYDDVAQEACLRVWRRFAQCRAEQSFGAWVKTVIASVATSTLRSDVPGYLSTHLGHSAASRSLMIQTCRPLRVSPNPSSIRAS